MNRGFRIRLTLETIYHTLMNEQHIIKREHEDLILNHIINEEVDSGHFSVYFKILLFLFPA